MADVRVRVALVVVVALCAAGAKAADFTVHVPGFADRDALVHVPDDVTGPVPLVLAFHGGGGSKEGMRAMTCAGGDVKSPTCLHALGDREHFAVVYPDGTPALLGKLRTWNAGGGVGPWRCVSGAACAHHVDDLAYVDALLRVLHARLHVDDARIYAIGMSNGAGFAQRLACARSDVFAAVASVAGGNPTEKAPGCTPPHPVAVLEVHGKRDPCWAWAGGTAGCLQHDDKSMVSVDDTIAGWVKRNGCTTMTTSPVVGTDASVHREHHADCIGNADVDLIVVDDGGHAWPGGQGYLPERRIGRTRMDVSANLLAWDFLRAHAKP